MSRLSSPAYPFPTFVAGSVEIYAYLDSCMLIERISSIPPHQEAPIICI